MNIGFIGLGTMGQPMARHLIDAGHALHVWARRPESMRPLVEAGAVAHPSPRIMAEHCEAVFFMVTDSADVEEVLLGEEGAGHGAPAGAVMVVSSTISPVATRRFAEEAEALGLEMLDAPVSGGPAGAEAASLAIMVGGRETVFERMRPVFERLGKTILYMGDHGAGQVTKACGQLALTVATEATAEALALARRCGVDPERVRQAMLGGLAASRVMELFGVRMTARDFGPGIDTRFYHKDLGIVLDLAHQAGQSLPAAALVMQQINGLMARGEDRSDFSALIRMLEPGNSD
ncbi:MAG: 2-hydroxy-3-oxopropionate reductase [Gammaproteobacteria bacterium]